jgi:hypothetical protein
MSLIFTSLVLVTWLAYILGRFMVSEQDLVYQIKPNIVIKTWHCRRPNLSDVVACRTVKVEE